MINKSDLFPIGIGTWGIGGFAEKNPGNQDATQIKSISFMLQHGFNYIELNVWTAQGHSIELVSKGANISRVKRDKLFLSQAIYSYTSPTIKDAMREIQTCLKLFNTSYVDSISLNEAAISSIGKKNVFELYHQLIDQKIIRFINLNNPSLASLREAISEFGDKLFSIKIGFNFEIRENEDNGIIRLAKEKEILCVIYQPLRRNRTALRNWPLLVELSKKYNKTQNQIILNWIRSKGFLPISKSESVIHIKEHLSSLDFTLDREDLKKLDEFRPPNYKPPLVYWGASGDGVRIDQLSNVFDEDYDKQMNNKK